MNNTFDEIKIILQRNGLERLIEDLSEQQTIQLIKEETGIDISLPLCENLYKIEQDFYSKNWVSIYTIISKQDLKSLYHLVQKLV